MICDISIVAIIKYNWYEVSEFKRLYGRDSSINIVCDLSEIYLCSYPANKRQWPAQVFMALKTSANTALQHQFLFYFISF